MSLSKLRTPPGKGDASRWDSLPDNFLAALGLNLSSCENRKHVAAARLACADWARQLAAGCRGLLVYRRDGAGPKGVPLRFTGITRLELLSPRTFSNENGRVLTFLAPTLTHLLMNHMWQCVDMDYAFLGWLLKLEHLDLSSTSFKDVRILHPLARLKTLVLCDTRVNDMAPLSMLPALTGLYMESGYRDMILKMTGADMPSLRSLRIRYCNLTGPRFSEQTPNLTSIELSGISTPDELLVDLSALAELRQVRIDGCTDVTPAGIVALQALSKLESLCFFILFRSVEERNAYARAVIGMPSGSLKSLSTNVFANDDILTLADRHPGLTHLEALQSYITVFLTTIPIHRFPALETLVCHHPWVDEVRAAAQGRVPELTVGTLSLLREVSRIKF